MRAEAMQILREKGAFELKNLTNRQEAWARSFAACGNSRKAAREAGYSEKSVGKAAAFNASNPLVMKKVREIRGATRIADESEVYEFLTYIMRSEDFKAADRTRAAEMISKRGLTTEKEIKVYFNVPRPKEVK